MNTIPRLIQAGIAAFALAAVSTPALSWAPPHVQYDRNGTPKEYFPDVWIQDDYDNEWRMFA